MPVITVERQGPLATLWLDAPERRNAMGVAFWEELPQRVAEVNADGEVRCLVVAARGASFTVGLDLREMAPLLMPDPQASPAQRAQRLQQGIRRLQAAISSLEDCDKPVIAAVHGHCIGGGVDLITACDLRLCSDDARFSVRETRMAMVADLGTLQRLPGIVGDGHAAEMVLSGADFDADYALRTGLVNAVHSSVETLHAAARERAEQLAANSPLAVQGAKAVLRAARRQRVDRGLELVGLWNSAFLHSRDLEEALTAFLEKRPPRFTGR